MLVKSVPGIDKNNFRIMVCRNGSLLKKASTGSRKNPKDVHVIPPTWIDGLYMFIPPLGP